MSIPETQLETWSHQGAIKGSSETYRTIKDVLEAAGTPYADKRAEVFLQGSYGNDTNIYAESDVDIVIVSDATFYSDLAALPDDQKAAWRRSYSDSTYTHKDFKREVLTVLAKAFGNDVVVGDKAIRIKPSGNRRKSDVIASMKYRRYYKFNGINDQSYDEGVCFFNSAGDRVANYPKQHSTNLTAQHQASNEWLKPMVRIWKNLRTKLVEDRAIQAAVAPSYFIEGLLYNVPADLFGGNYADSFVRVFDWIQQMASKSDLVCANRQYYLLRDADLNCWPTADCERFLHAAAVCWRDWHK